MPHRFFVTPDSIHAGTVTFRAAQARQMRDVLRMRPAQEIVVLDNCGSEYRVVLDELGRDQARGTIFEQHAARGEPHTKLVLYQALLKADKFEWVLQKGTELGISTFAPVVTERTIAQTVGKQKMTRWQQILGEAAEQSGRGKIPALLPLLKLQDAFAAARMRGGTFLIPWEEERERDLASVLASSRELLVQLMIGPEGGFTPEEIETARAYGAESITLGPRILRAETAGLVAASAVLYARGDLSRR